MHALYHKLFGSKDAPQQKKTLFHKKKNTTKSTEAHEPKESTTHHLIGKIKNAIPEALHARSKTVYLGVHKVHLRHVETVDKSGPFIEPGYKLKKYDRKPLLKELAEIRSLKKVTSIKDRSAPNLTEFKTNYRARRFNRQPLLASIRTGTHLKHVEFTNDRSAPRLRNAKRRDFPTWTSVYRRPYLADIERGQFTLRKVNNFSRQKFAPYLPQRSEFKRRTYNIKPLLADIRKGKQLRHTQTTDKTTLQFLQKGQFKSRMSNRRALLNDVRKGKQLRHVNTFCDKSAPRLPLLRGAWGWERSQRKLAFLKDIELFNRPLRKTTTVDKSRPMLPKRTGFKLRQPADRRALLADIRRGVPLKKANTYEYLVTFTKSEFKFKPSERTSLLREVKLGVPLKTTHTFDKSKPFLSTGAVRAM